NVRRALLQAPIDRIGLGGYLHLVQDFPDFCDYIEKISDEFRTIKQFHKDGKPYVLKPKVAVLSFWGKLRSWTCSGHYHETYMHDLININESLSGMPLDVRFISFDDIKNGILEDINIIINAGYEGSAWSGGEIWADERIVTALTEWVHKGGAFIGVNEPSASRGFDTLFRMAHVLGIDKDTGERVCHGKWKFKAFDKSGIIASGSSFAAKENIYLTDGKAEVLLEKDSLPVVSAYSFGKGKGIYFSSYKHSTENAKTLLNAILYASGEPLTQKYIPDNLYVECAYYPESKTLVAINNSNSAQSAGIDTDSGKIKVYLEPYDTQIIRL
ncbi:MAG: 1,3-beta-galactosyl-N-acetylhexosamine phosphorylase, partial [Oscillospiraceae bacterium]|nr:1,3-beta-galactosyl-N-acetylhexosamine phosphorylase [Oscillospiraceae bacterium]